MTSGILLLNFGEPEDPAPGEVTSFLEKIFLANSALGEDVTEEEIRARSLRLAEARAPSLVEEYRAIGGSPLNAQARHHTRMLEEALRRRGRDVRCYDGMQFTAPSIPDAVARAKADGVDRLVLLPVYPLCGRSTTVAALDSVKEAVDAQGWDVILREITGWHRHPEYIRLHADAIRAFTAAAGVDLWSARTAILFSAHGTPVRYLKEGPRYQKYVEEICERIARELSVDDYHLGYQNHANRPIEWTSPDVDQVLHAVDADRVVVVAVSFMHEQSETLVDLDGELREEAGEAGLEFFRVPIPWDDPRFGEILADLAEPLLEPVPALGKMGLKRCLCRPDPNTYCLNAAG